MICTWQEDRKVSRQLTLHYKRVMYLLRESQAARDAMGKYVSVRETEAGEVTVTARARSLPPSWCDMRRCGRQGWA